MVAPSLEALTPAKGDDSEAVNSSQSTMRTSSRLQSNQKPQKELLVRRRVELLDEDDGKAPKKKPNVRGRVSSSVEPEPEVNGGGEVTNSVEKSDRVKVKETLRLFNKYYLHFVQEEEKRSVRAIAEKKASKKSKKGTLATEKKGVAKRPDWKAMTKMMEGNEILNASKRFGSIPGIDVGHQFYSRTEMVAVGFHSHWLNEIDYIGQNCKNEEYSNYTMPLAVSILILGMYEDDLDNAVNITYTGQGGHNLTGDKRQIKKKKLDRGNLALKNCVEQDVPVRVVRGHNCKDSYTGKIYIYDGLYKVVKYWEDKDLSGFTVFKFSLKRVEGQPPFTTNQVQFINGRVPQSTAEIFGLVCEDISGGLEEVPIPATNTVDDPPVAPTGYTYCNSIQVSKNVKLPTDSPGCNCKGSCVDVETCACAKLNGSDFPYVHRDGGRLIEAKDIVFECGPQCACGPSCANRTSQRGQKFRFEVFRTPMKGWAVRSWDFIPSGAPVCEFIGILRRTEDADSASENYYIFDADGEQTMRGLDGRERQSRSQSLCIPTVNLLEMHDDQRSDNASEYCIDVGSNGNIARFINHSCEPNLFVQCVLSSHHGIARVVLFAADNIPPLQELTYDYGYALDSVLGPDGKVESLIDSCEDENDDIQDVEVSLGADKRDGSSDSKVDQSQEGQYIVAPLGSNLRDTPNRKTRMIKPVFTGTTIIGLETATSQIIGRESMQTLTLLGEEFSGVNDCRKRHDIIKKKMIAVCTGRTSQIKEAINHIKRRVNIRKYFLNLFKRRYFKRRVCVRDCALGLFRFIKAKHSLDNQPYPAFGAIIGGKDGLWVINVVERPTRRNISRYVRKVRKGEFVALGSGDDWAEVKIQNRVSVDTPNAVACNLFYEALTYAAMHDPKSGNRIHVDLRTHGDRTFEEVYNAGSLIAYRDNFDAVHEPHTLFALVPRREIRPNYVSKCGGILPALRGFLQQNVKESCHFVAAKNKYCFHRIIFDRAYDLESFMSQMEDFTDTINIPGKGIEGIPAGFTSGKLVYEDYLMLVARSSFELLERIIAME